MQDETELSNYLQDKIEYFNFMCKKRPQLVQEMADDKHILEHDIIDVCMANGITFKPEFLKEIGFKPPKI